MIVDFKSIALLGKPLFTWTVVQTPMSLTAAMPKDEACFAYVLEGECFTYSETENLKIKTKEAFLAKCGNYTTKLKAVDSVTRYSTIVVHFHLEVLQKIYAQGLPAFLTKKEAFRGANTAKVASNELIEHYINNIQLYFKYPRLATEDVLILKLKEIILLLTQTQNSPQVLTLMQNLFSERTIEFKEIIEGHICSDLTIKELAQLTNRSLSSFKKAFKNIYRDTPASYRITKRIEKVANLLLLSDEAITTIAYDCGFKTVAHLSRVFKRHYGTSPSQYRLDHSDK
ncbi:helix-turn-helix domain-containing protein [Aureispira anguillae]|uniref:AraC family transcriptional regulator n=1 Tax=Aureispira anguillae TaxID=2864201 RepID=A0A915VK08_9BACT|nr:AraC family transcriptional regulator [Aureispira anguillae]BDS09457.1 AraC family transcriptional regulator [Aureispira anguillae]